MLEENQKTMGEIINNVMNSGNTGPTTTASQKQQVFSESRRMLFDMMIPFNQQLNEMKLLYEGTKSCSSDLGTKIDELKRIFVMQSGSLTGHSTSSSNPFHGHMGGTDMLDPNIMKKGLEDIKEQMRDVQKEAILIETDLERRRTETIMKEQQKRHLPQTITDEFASF